MGLYLSMIKRNSILLILNCCDGSKKIIEYFFEGSCASAPLAAAVL